MMGKVWSYKGPQEGDFIGVPRKFLLFRNFVPGKCHLIMSVLLFLVTRTFSKSIETPASTYKQDDVFLLECSGQNINFEFVIV